MEVAFRTIRSRRKFVNNPKIRKYMDRAVDTEVKPHFIDRFKMVVSNWEHKVDFQAKKYLTSDYTKLYVYPTGANKQIWAWVSGGTKGPYKIPKSGPGLLSFRTGYKPKTKAVGKFGGPGVFTGARVTGIMQVKQHPGIEAREFEKTIMDDEKGWYNREMENAWRRAIRSL